MFRKAIFVTVLMLSIIIAEGFYIGGVEDSEELNDGISVNSTVSLVSLPQQKIRYRIGQRKYHDHLVGSVRKSLSWSTPHDVNLRFSYPPAHQKNGAILTYVQLMVMQTSALGKAYPVDGGIGQRHITISVGAKNTYNFAYVANFFGI